MIDVIIFLVLGVGVNFRGDDIDADEDELLESRGVFVGVDGGEKVVDGGFVKDGLHLIIHMDNDINI